MIPLILSDFYIIINLHLQEFLMQKIIQTQNLTKIYPGNITGVSKLNLTVEKGEIFGFLGSNGAGKTTTIRLLLNLIFPTDGTGKVLGKDIVKEHTEVTEKIGYIPSSIKPNRNLTGYEFVNLMTKYYKSGDMNKAKSLFSRLELSSKDLKRKVKEYSTGMARKLAIVQAFAHSTELLIMDEPTEGLDPIMQHEFYEMLREYRADGGTVFISSHHLREIEKICDRAGIIREGRLVAVENVKDLMNSAARTINIRFKKKTTKKVISSEHLEVIEFDGINLKAAIRGDINKVLKTITKFDLIDVTMPPISLEDVFLGYYKEKN